MQPHTIAQLAHVELLTPTPDESVAFFKNLLGMIETHRERGSVYLRGYQDTYHHSLVVTESERAGLGHAAYRTVSEEALDHWAARIKLWAHGLQPNDARLIARDRAPVRRSARDVYVYFDNDAKVRAPFDARSLRAKLPPR